MSEVKKNIVIIDPDIASEHHYMSISGNVMTGEEWMEILRREKTHISLLEVIQANNGEWISLESDERFNATATTFTAVELDEMKKLFGTAPLFCDANSVVVRDGDMAISIRKLRDGTFDLYYYFDSKPNGDASITYNTETLADLPELVKMANDSSK